MANKKQSRFGTLPPRYRFAGMSVATTPFMALLAVLISYRARRRFNAAAPRVQAVETSS